MNKMKNTLVIIYCVLGTAEEMTSHIEDIAIKTIQIKMHGRSGWRMESKYTVSDVGTTSSGLIYTGVFKV